MGGAIKRAMPLMAAVMLGGCVSVPVPPPPAPAAEPEAPPQVTTRSFLIRGPRFPVGQSANVRVCVDASGTVVSVELAGSSGESRFDEFAITWARQADVQSWARKNGKQPSCGNVRVEIGPGSRPGLGSSIDSALG